MFYITRDTCTVKLLGTAVAITFNFIFFLLGICTRVMISSLRISAQKLYCKVSTKNIDTLSEFCVGQKTLSFRKEIRNYMRADETIRMDLCCVMLNKEKVEKKSELSRY